MLTHSPLQPRTVPSVCLFGQRAKRKTERKWPVKEDNEQRPSQRTEFGEYGRLKKNTTNIGVKKVLVLTNLSPSRGVEGGYVGCR